MGSDGHRQRGAVRYLLSYAQTHDADVRRSESFGVGGHERYHVLSALSGSAQLGPAKARCEPHSLPAPAFLYVRLCAIDVARRSTVPPAVGARIGAADVRREEYDVRVGSAPRPLFDGVC